MNDDLDQKAYEGQFCTCNIARQMHEAEVKAAASPGGLKRHAC